MNLERRVFQLNLLLVDVLADSDVPHARRPVGIPVIVESALHAQDGFRDQPADDLEVVLGAVIEPLVHSSLDATDVARTEQVRNVAGVYTLPEQVLRPDNASMRLEDPFDVVIPAHALHLVISTR